MASFEELPGKILWSIFQYLNGKQLALCGMVCRRFYDLTESDDEWKLRCERDWNISHSLGNFTTWKDCYALMYGRFAPYLTCYKRVSKCWQKIFAVTRERCPRIYVSLRRDGTDEETLRHGLNLESYGTKLPLEYRCSYRLCNGQRGYWNNTFGDRSAGLFGSRYHNDMGDYMCSYPSLGSNPGSSSRDSAIRRCCLTVIFITGYGGRKGPIGLCVRDSLTSPARRDCLNDADHESLNGSVVSLLFADSDEFFIYGKSFIEFLEHFADRIAHYPVDNHRFLSYEFNAECDTGPFTVTVRTRFIPESNAYPLEHREFNFLCWITMRMRPNACQSDSCQLETRHWVTIDADGKVETVEGPAVVGHLPVVGEFPVVRPGVEFSWLSRTSCSTPTGKTSGYFTMRKLNGGGEIRIACPEFHLVALPYVQAMKNA